MSCLSSSTACTLYRSVDVWGVQFRRPTGNGKVNFVSARVSAEQKLRGQDCDVGNARLRLGNGPGLSAACHVAEACRETSSGWRHGGCVGVGR
jgi:hypothetical protein